MTATTSFPAARGSPSRLVLIADASRAQRLLLRLQLEQAGYVVIEAETGDQALAAVRGNAPDFILSDWSMITSTGEQLSRACRAVAREGYGYFVILAPCDDLPGAPDLTETLAGGIDDVVTKPVTRTELMARLAAGERVLGMHAQLSAANRELQQTLAELRRAQDVMESDLREARKLQQGLIRERQRVFWPYQASLLMRPAGMIGGDLVGFRQLGGDTVAFYALDVSGHGVTSALLTARLAAELESNEELLALSPAESVMLLNERMLRGVRTDSYLTMVYCHLDLVAGDVRLVQAGHPHPIVQRANGAQEAIGTGGLPVGVFPGARFDEVTLQLYPGDRLFIASDGIVEATSPHGRQLGDEGLSAILQLNAPLRGTAFLESLCWSVSNFAGGKRGDDISAVLIEHLAEAPVVPIRQSG